MTSQRDWRRKRSAASGPARSLIEQLERRSLLSAGQLDLSFGGGDGKVALNAPDQASLNLALPPAPVGVAVGPDGRTVVSQNLLVNGTPQAAVQRLRNDGSVDLGFGTGGRVTLNNTTITRITLLPDGHILLLGSVLARLNNNGSADTTFGAGTGSVTSPTLVRGFIVQSDGKVLITGQTGGPGSAAAIWRYNVDGSVDQSYGASGSRVLSFDDGAGGTVTPAVGGVGLDAIGRAVVSMTVNPGQSSGALGAARLGTGGAIDTTFGINGLARFAIANPSTGVATVGGGGVIYVMGTTNLGATSSRGSLIAFSSDGKRSARTETGLGAGSAAVDVRLQANGRPVVVGWQLAAGNNKVLIQRFRAVNASNITAPLLDTSFNGTGTAQVDYMPGGNGEQTLGTGDLGWVMRFTPGGRIVVGGTSFQGSTRQFTVTRLQGDTGAFGSISGTMWNDYNGDGVRQSLDTPLANFGVFLDRDNNGVFDGTDVRAFSDTQGNYQFVGLPAGTYNLVQRPGGLYRNTVPTGGKYSVVLGNAEAAAGRDFALTARGSISGLMFEDLDGDGLRQANETVLPGWGCFIDFDDNGAFDGADIRALAGADGVYVLANLPAGTYRVRQNTPAGWERTVPLSQPYVVTLGTNESARGRNFGVRAVGGSYVNANRTLVVAGTIGADTISLFHDVPSTGGGTIFVTINGVGQGFAAPGVARIFLDARGGNDAIIESGNDATVGADGGLGIVSTLLGGNGNDTINLTVNDTRNDRGPTNLIDGGADDDAIFSDANANVTLRGGEGNDSINNRPTFYNTAAIFGDGGNDTVFYFTNAAMQISGGAGTDVLDTGTNIVLGDVLMSLDGLTNDGAAGLAQSNVQADVENLRLIAHQGNLTVTGSAADNQITASNDNTVVVNGLGGNDRLSASGAAVTINGGEGNDTVLGSGASVFFSGGNGIDLLDLSARTANNVVILDGSAAGGQAGEVDRVDGTIEVAIGGSGNDRIVGTGASNTLAGNGGNDTLTSNGGGDLLRGGEGNDTFFAKDGVFDDINGGNGIDQGQTDLTDSAVSVEVVTH